MGKRVINLQESTMYDQIVFGFTVIRTSAGFMIQDESGDYVHDKNHDNCFDTLSEAYEVLLNHLKHTHKKLKTYSVKLNASMVVYVEALTETEAHARALGIAVEYEYEPDWQAAHIEEITGE